MKAFNLQEHSNIARYFKVFDKLRMMGCQVRARKGEEDTYLAASEGESDKQAGRPGAVWKLR